MQPIKELSSVAGQCGRRGCELIRQLANDCGMHPVTVTVIKKIKFAF